MAHRPKPFLERKVRPAPAPPPGSWFQRARDWTGFLVSISSLLTAWIALQNTLTGPRPFLSPPIGDAVTILRSDQFNPGLPLRDQTGNQTYFPLLLIQPGLGNRAAPPNGIGVRAIDADLKVSYRGNALFQSSYVWYRFTESTVASDQGDTDHLVFQSVSQAAAFDLPGGATWSREVLLVPQKTWAEQNWNTFAHNVTQVCSTLNVCHGQVIVHARLDDGVSLSGTCTFTLGQHFLNHLEGIERRYYSSPVCSASSEPSAKP